MAIHPILAGRMVFCPKCKGPVIAPQDEALDAVRVDADVRMQSERLELRLTQPGDWGVLLPITSDPINFAYELSPPDDRRMLIKNLKRSRFPDGFKKSLHLMFLATSWEDGTAIGLIHLRLDPGHLLAHLGIMLHHPFHRMGYGTEAVGEVVRFGFEKLGLHRISAACDQGNTACVGLLEKSGFELEGTTKDGAYHLERGWVSIRNFGLISDRVEKSVRN